MFLPERPQPRPETRDVVAVYLRHRKPQDGAETRRFHAGPLNAAAMLLFDLELDPRDCWAREVEAGARRVALVHRDAGAHASGRIVAFVAEGLTELELNMALMALAARRGPAEPSPAAPLSFAARNPFAGSGLSAPAPIGPSFL